MAEAQWIEAGWVLRGQLRRALIKAGYRFSEPSKGLFIINEPPEVYASICRQLREQGAAG